MEIRESLKAERPPIETIHRCAFGDRQGEEIARLVHALFDDPSAQPLLSLICVEGKELIGHILFTKAVVMQSPEPVNARILAPLAVAPDAQNKGVGGKLIQKGLRRLKKLKVELVFVLGHPDYYPRFGFTPAGALGFEAPYPISEKHAAAWMVQELRPGLLGKLQGTIQCADQLNKPEYWRE